MNKTIFIGLLLSLIILSAYVTIVFLLESSKAFNFIREDGIVENTQVVCYILSALFMLYSFIISRSESGRYFLKTKMNWFYLLFAVFCLVILGEEISWGERLFDYKATEKFQEAGGTSLHNREYLFKILGIQITAARIFFPIVLFYFVLIPFLNEYSQKIRNFFNRISLPLVPMLVAVLTFINFSIWQVSYRFFDNPVKWEGLPDYAFFQTAEEVYEVIFALLLLWSCYSIYLNVRKRESVS
jgi:hypothetical protein